MSAVAGAAVAAVGAGGLAVIIGRMVTSRAADDDTVIRFGAPAGLSEHSSQGVTESVRSRTELQLKTSRSVGIVDRQRGGFRRPSLASAHRRRPVPATSRTRGQR